MTHRKRTVGVATLGCKVNQYESRAMEEALESRGYEICPHDAVCDAYIVNTCTVTAESDRKCRQLIRRLLAQNPAAYTVVTGCFAQADPTGAALEGVDAVIGNAQKMRVVEVLDALFAQGHKNPTAYTEVFEIKQARCFEPMHITSFDRTRTYVKIEDKERPNSKKAILRYKLIGHSQNYHLLEVDLQTGRHHQIRCQLAKMGCPIKGDLKYGSPRSNPDGSICLHARRVTFVHPVSKEVIDITAPLPAGNLWNGFDMD